MSDEAWNAGFAKCLGVQLSGETGEVDEYGNPVRDDHVVMLLNAHHEPMPFALPEFRGDSDWERLFDTADPDASDTSHRGGESYRLEARSMAVFRAVRRREPARAEAQPAKAAQKNGEGASQVSPAKEAVAVS
jgi:glycogen operon protein